MSEFVINAGPHHSPLPIKALQSLALVSLSIFLRIYNKKDTVLKTYLLWWVRIKRRGAQMVV
jgi:hypothetical protein